ncbi:hypothetical protein L2E82_02204 [Cichorium intybus]|uniref:Uncharacterized protein n=1 Tax=Cichorium intybus TaxID=13427 RepID=A0ACB9H150_CICIN|nr:hypothetical protein L2E82_02204 [Cichorium intybus]
MRSCREEEARKRDRFQDRTVDYEEWHRDSELPLASGLGSSAAYCVSLAGAFLPSSDSVNLDFSSED